MIQCNENYSVYRHRRLDNNQIFYVGIAKYNTRPYDKILRSNFWKNITNKTNYTIEIIAKNLDKESAIDLEIFLIQEYGRINNKTGILCNMTDGGEGRFNSKHSEKTLLKLRNAKLNKKLSIKTKEKMSKNSYRCRKVINTSTNIIYNTLKEVSILFNIKPSTLSHYLNNTRTNKTTFKYLNND